MTVVLRFSTTPLKEGMVVVSEFSTHPLLGGGKRGKYFALVNRGGLLNSEQNPELCDARNDAQGTEP